MFIDTTLISHVMTDVQMEDLTNFEATMKSEDEGRSQSNQEDRSRYDSNFLKTDDNRNDACGYVNKTKEADNNYRMSTDYDKPDQHTLTKKRRHE
eukprot:8425904-Heterocapsa_arctica.AAC.1